MVLVYKMQNVKDWNYEWLNGIRLRNVFVSLYQSKDLTLLLPTEDLLSYSWFTIKVYLIIYELWFLESGSEHKSASKLAHFQQQSSTTPILKKLGCCARCQSQFDGSNLFQTSWDRSNKRLGKMWNAPETPMREHITGKQVDSAVTLKNLFIRNWIQLF